MAIGRIGCLLTEQPGTPTGARRGASSSTRRPPRGWARRPACRCTRPSSTRSPSTRSPSPCCGSGCGTGRSPPGETLTLYVAAYGVFRFFVEFVRGNEVAWLGLTRPQLFLLVTIPLLLARIAWIASRGASVATPKGCPVDRPPDDPSPDDPEAHEPEDGPPEGRVPDQPDAASAEEGAEPPDPVTPGPADDARTDLARAKPRRGSLRLQPPRRTRRLRYPRVRSPGCPPRTGFRRPMPRRRRPDSSARLPPRRLPRRRTVDLEWVPVLRRDAGFGSRDHPVLRDLRSDVQLPRSTLAVHPRDRGIRPADALRRWRRFATGALIVCAGRHGSS